MDKLAGREYYKNTSFTAEHKKKLHTLFCGFIDLFKITLNLIGNNFRRFILWPFLWQLSLLLLCSGLMIFSLSPLMQNNWDSFNNGIQSFNSLDFSQEENINQFSEHVKNKLIGGLFGKDLTTMTEEQTADWFANNYPGIFWSIFLISSFWMVGQLWIQVRRIYILNNRSVAGVMSVPDKLNRAFYRALSFVLIQNLVYSIIISFSGVPFILSALVSTIVQIYLLGYLGLTDSMVVNEDKPLVAGMQDSYDLSKYFFVRNLIRWTWYQALIFIINAFVLIVLDFVFAVMLILGQFWLGLFFLLIFFFVFQFIIEGFFLTYRYVAFYNLRHVGTAMIPNEESEVDSSEEDKKIATGLEKSGAIMSSKR